MNLRRRYISGIALIALLIPLSACTQALGGASDMGGGVTFSSDSLAGSVEMAAPEMEQMMADVSSVTEQQIIQQAWLDVEVADVSQGVDELTDLVQRFDGRIDQRSLNRGEHDSFTSASLHVRVPSDRLQEAIEEIGKVGKIRNESTNAQDVTLQHVDLTARIDSLGTSITRLEALLDDAATVTELIEVETALADRQAELESLTAQLEALTDQVDLASLFIEVRSETSPVGGTETSFIDALVAGFWSIATALNGLMIAAGYALPWIILIGIIITIILVAVKGRKKRKTTPEI